MKNKGLTVIELLVALTIFAIVAVAIYSVFSTGIIGWKKGEAAVSLFQEIRLSLDSIAREMRNQVSYNEVKLVGKADEVYFISVIPFPEEGKSEYMRLAKIKYFLEERENNLSLFRERVWVPSLEEVSEEEIDKMKLISGIKSFDFQYGEKEVEEEEATLTWQSEWEDKENGLQAIKISLSIGGESAKNLTRVIYLPLSSPLGGED